MTRETAEDRSQADVDAGNDTAVIPGELEVLDEVLDEVEAEIVDEVVEDERGGCGCSSGPPPPGQRRIPSDEILDENGVPYSRTGLRSRIGGSRPLLHYRPGG